MQALEDMLNGFIQPVSKTPYSLDSIKALMAHLGNPQDQVRVIHVAGTSGKTSTAYYAAELLRSAGKTVGLSVSPHIDTVRERTQVNGALIVEPLYLQLMGEFMNLVVESEITVSYFELLVAFSYWVWAKLGLDYAVMEVGLGGLLDATNVVTRSDKVCVITDIGYDHQEILGNTLPLIAAQKAGIILPSNQVFVHQQPEEVMRVFRTTCESVGATLNVVEKATIDRANDLPLFQQRNLPLAYAAVVYAIDEKPPLDAVLNLQVPGRMEPLTYKGAQVFLDGSHNSQKIGALVESFKQRYPELSPTLVASFGVGRARYIPENLALLKQLSSRLIATDFSSQQDTKRESVDPEIIAKEADAQGFEQRVVSGVLEAVNEAVQMGATTVLVVGSFYALAEIRSLLRGE
jgi:dihydrofolate synthase / folylpolyglutamate synthase